MLWRRRYLDGGAGGGGGDTKPALRTDDIVVDGPDGRTVKGKRELAMFVERTAAALRDVRDGAVNAEKFEKASADLKEALDAAKEAGRIAARAEQMAKDAARSVPGGSDISEAALKTIPLMYDVSKDPEYSGRVSPQHYNLLMLSKQELDTLHEPVRKTVERFRYLHDAVVFADQFMTARDGQKYLKRGGMESLRMWGQYEPLAKTIKAAMSDANQSPWVPTGVGISIIEDIRPDLEVANYIETVPMPRSPYRYPVQGKHFKTFLIPETTADYSSSGYAPISAGGLGINTRDLNVAQVTFTAKKHAALMEISSEIEEDSIVPLIPAIRADFAFAVAAGLEQALIDGQVTSTIDTGDVPGATDVRASWNGLRYAATLTAANRDASTGIIVDDLTTVKGLLGKFGKKPGEGVWLTSYVGWAKLLNLKNKDGSGVVLTQEKFGANATFPTGVLGVCLGSPIVVADDYRQDLNAAGVMDGVDLGYTSILYFNRRGWKLGEVRTALIEASREWAFHTDQIAFRVTYRADFEPVRTPDADPKSWRVCGQVTGIQNS